MSITLMAYPMAFLIEPEKAKNEKLNKASNVTDADKNTAIENLRSIRVLTNITADELGYIMDNVDGKQVESLCFILSSGVNVQWLIQGKYAQAVLSCNADGEYLQSCGEKFFTELDSIAGRNVRLINSNEFFYYNYDTSYTKVTEIYSALKEEGAEQIFTTDNDAVVANLNGQSIKYFKPADSKTFNLEVEQKVTILNIGLRGDARGSNVVYGLTNLKIQTNIKPEELKIFLKKANYLYYALDSQTPLKNSDATLNWVLKNGYYVAEFSGSNNNAITKEAEIIFRKLNIAAGRDLRLINDLSTTVYTYKTNYTDKGILLNTLIEHGAEEILETGDEVSCKLFGMEMVYYKKEGTNGYTLDITQVSDKSECEDVINDLNEEYGLNIQEMTYNKIKERLDKENMRIESETVMDDNSIVLTIDI